MDVLRRVLEYSKRYSTRLLLSIVTATFYGIFSAAPTYVVKHAVDTIFVAGQEQYIIPFVMGFILLFTLKGVFAYLSTYYMHWVGNRVINDIRADLFERIIFFPLSFFKKKTTGQLMAHFLNDVAMIQNASSNAVKNGVRSFFEATFLIFIALFQNWKLAILTALVAPIIGISIQRMGRAVKKASRLIQREMGCISSLLQEIFVGIREIKIFRGEAIEKKRFIVHLSNYFSSVMRNVKVEAFGPAFIESVAMFGSGFVFYVAAQQVLSGSISPGQLTSFFAALLLAYQPLKRLINVYAEIQYGVAAAERVFEVMDLTYPALHDRTVTLPSFNKELTLHNVAFAYTSDSPVLNDVSLTIRKGERIGLVGSSGSGKSTFSDLLLGFLRPSAGEICIDGIDTTRITQSSLRGVVGCVSQQTFLFNDTVYANIAYANPTATRDEVIHACRQSYAHEFIEKFSDGYQTLVGENGTLLSGGQKQRITIARVLLKNPDIIIFDEATSALDQKSEEMICRALEQICKTKTVIIISHRMSLIGKMDRIFVIKNKQFVELAPSQLYDYSASLDVV